MGSRADRLRSRRSVVPGAIAVLALCMASALALNAYASSPFGSAYGASTSGMRTAESASVRAVLATALTFTPSPSAVDVPLDTPVAVSTATGWLTSVRVTGANGAVLPGTLAASRQSWQANTTLAANTTYQVSAQLSGLQGPRGELTSTFQTLTPVARVGARVFPDNLTVGVGQPVVVRFDHAITGPPAQAAALRHFHVTASKPVSGGWRWFSPRELHFRPASYWPTGEHVSVSGNLDGWNAGDGMWGAGQPRASFTVGDAHMSVANLATHQMTVTSNGRPVATYPISAGRDKYPTMGGTHIVMDRESVVHMVSSTNGIPVNSPDGYDELVYQDVHISDSGEYVHAAPWSVNAQGNTNVSHGCINLSPADATAFFNFSRIGDVVAVTGGTRPPEHGDHGVMDWSTPWSEWTPA